MKEEITKRSPVLGREARYLKTGAISRLPPFLCLQFVRFFWKNDIKAKTKVLKVVREDQFEFVTTRDRVCFAACRFPYEPRHPAVREPPIEQGHRRQTCQANGRRICKIGSHNPWYKVKHWSAQRATHANEILHTAPAPSSTASATSSSTSVSDSKVQPMDVDVDHNGQRIELL